MQRVFCAFAMLSATTREGARSSTKMRRPVTGMHMV